MKDCIHDNCKWIYIINNNNNNRYVLGHDAMRKMSNSNVLIAGMKGLGIEVGMCILCVHYEWLSLSAKNVVLAGVKSVTIYDTDNIELRHLSSQVIIIIIIIIIILLCVVFLYWRWCW